MSSAQDRPGGAPQKKPATFAFSVLVVAATAVGVAACWPLPQGLTDTVPDTPFTDGHRIALGFGTGTVGPLTLPHAGGVDFRPLLWPANLLAGVTGPIPALNLIFLLTPLFNAVCGWLLGRAMRAAPWGCFVLGAALAWSPWVHTTLANGQLEQAVIGGAALTWAAALATVQARRAWCLALPVCAAQSFGVGAAAPHVALAAGVGLAGWAAVDVWVGREGGWRGGRLHGDRDRAVRWAAVLAATAIGAWAAGRYHAPSFDTAARLFAPFGSVDAAPVGPQVKRAVLLADLVFRPAAPPRLANGVVHSGTLGIALVLAALVGVRWRRAPLVAGLACLVLAFGAGTTIPLPYALLERLSPTIAASGTPYRFLIGTIVGLAAAAAALPWGPRTAVPFVLVLWAEAWSGDPRALPLKTRPVERDPSSSALKAGTGPVLDLPVAGPRCKEGSTHFLLEAITHDRPVPVVMRPGYSAWIEAEPGADSDRWDQDLARLLDRGLATCDPAAIAAIHSAGFTAVVEHGHRSCNLDPAESACLRTAFGPGRSAGTVTWWELRAETPPSPP